MRTKRRRIEFVIGLVVAGVCASALGQDTAAAPDCLNTAGTQMELNQCASEEAKRADAELNAIYSKLLTELAKKPLAAAKVTAERNAWLKYRDAYVNAMYPEDDKQGKYGSMFPMEVDLLYATITREQIKAMTDLRRSLESDYEIAP